MLTVSLLVCAMMALAAADDNSTVSAPVHLCPEGFIDYNGRCYQFVSSLLTWAEAEINCQSMEANLASVHSLEEDRMISAMIQINADDNPEAWIGGSSCQKENHWFWSNGKVSPFRNFCDRPIHHPAKNDGCLLTNHRARTCWFNRDCSLYRASVCALNIPASLTCPEGFIDYNGRCYQFVSSLLTWAEAEINCQSMGANLASVHSVEEDRFLQEMIYSKTHDETPAWIGGSSCQKENHWFWTNGKVSPFRNWCDSPVPHSENNHGCMLMNNRARTCWMNQDCSLYRESVCALNIPASLTCPEGFNEYNGRCYQFVSSLLTWAEAEINCQSMGANLASVHSVEEDRFLQEMIYSKTHDETPAWIGGSSCQKDNQWLWSNGKVSPFRNWCDGPIHHPAKNDGCMLMNHKARTCWMNRDCSFYRPSVCALNM